MATAFRTQDIEIPTPERHNGYLKAGYGLALTTRFPVDGDEGRFDDVKLKYHIDMFLPGGLEEDPVLFAVFAEGDKEYLGLSNYRNHVQKIIRDGNPVEVTGMDVRQLIRVSRPVAQEALNEYRSIGQRLRRAVGNGKEHPSDYIETERALRHASKRGQDAVAFRFCHAYISDSEIPSPEDNWFSEDNDRIQREMVDYISMDIL